MKYSIYCNIYIAATYPLLPAEGVLTETSFILRCYILLEIPQLVKCNAQLLSCYTSVGAANYSITVVMQWNTVKSVQRDQRCLSKIVHFGLLGTLFTSCVFTSHKKTPLISDLLHRLSLDRFRCIYYSHTSCENCDSIHFYDA